MSTLRTIRKECGLRSRTLGLALSLSLLMAGCATPGPDNIQATEQEIARFDRMTTVDAIREAEQVLAKSEEKKIPFYAPRHYELAGEALSEARQRLAENAPREKVVQKVAVAEAVLQNGDRVMRRVKEMLNPELQIKENLDKLDAAQIYTKDYSSLLDRLNQVIRNIENGQAQEADSLRPGLKQQMEELQVRAVRHAALNETEELLKRVKYRGAKQLAPLTYAEAMQVFRRAEEFIQLNAHDSEKVNKIAAEAHFAAKRALYVTEEVAALSHKVERSLEQVVLDEEYRLFRIARTLGLQDMRDNSLEVQSEMLAKAATELQDEKGQQIQVANILREAIVNQASSNGDLTRLNNKVKSLNQEKREWLAKDALYGARLNQLREEIAGLQQRTQQAEQQVAETKPEAPASKAAQTASQAVLPAQSDKTALTATATSQTDAENRGDRPVKTENATAAPAVVAENSGDTPIKTETAEAVAAPADEAPPPATEVAVTAQPGVDKTTDSTENPALPDSLTAQAEKPQKEVVLKETHLGEQAPAESRPVATAKPAVEQTGAIARKVAITEEQQPSGDNDFVGLLSKDDKPKAPLIFAPEESDPLTQQLEAFVDSSQ